MSNGRQEVEKAGDETRTRDMQLGKLPLYQLSYARGGQKYIVTPKPSPEAELPLPDAVNGKTRAKYRSKLGFS